MQITIEHLGRRYRTDLQKGIDLSSILGKPGMELKAWHSPDVQISAVKSGDWVGSIKKGSSVNFYDIRFNPHGNGSHTETYGHISPLHESVNDHLKNHHFIARLVHLSPEQKGEDKIVTWRALQEKVKKWNVEALIVKTGDYPLGYDFSATNPPYFDHHVLEFVREMGIQHFLTDLPSVDREEDGGKLLSHKAFWNYPEEPREGATISELLHIPSSAKEGLYLLNLQVAAFQNDASPCRPVIYPLEEL